MSFSDEPSLSLGQKLGCFAYLILSSAVVLFLAMMAVLGDCASEMCMPDWQRLLLWPGSMIVAILGGFWLTKILMRDKD